MVWMMGKRQGNLEDGTLPREVGLVEPPRRVPGQPGHGAQAGLSLSSGGRAGRSVLSEAVGAGACLVMPLVTRSARHSLCLVSGILIAPL